MKQVHERTTFRADSEFRIFKPKRLIFWKTHIMPTSLSKKMTIFPPVRFYMCQIFKNLFILEMIRTMTSLNHKK